VTSAAGTIIWGFSSLGVNNNPMKPNNKIAGINATTNLDSINRLARKWAILIEDFALGKLIK